MSEILEQSSVEQLLITEEAKGYLKTTAKWTNFLAIIDFISIGFIFLGGIILTLLGNTLSSAYNNVGGASFPFVIIGVVYFILGAVLILPTTYLYRFGKTMPQTLALNNSQSLETSLKNLKSYWKFIGIMTIVVLGICFLLIPISIVAMIASAGAF